MDPRHPEKVLPRIKELVEQYDKLATKMNKASLHELAELEREGIGVVREICLTAPRLHDAVIQMSNNRRVNVTRQATEKPVVKENLTTEKPVDKPVKKKPAKKGKK